jgi:DNA-directed RNA polymerase II subunit RPB3
MKIKDIHGQDSKLEFTIEDVDVSVVNSLRRIILSEIPNIAFDFDPLGHGKSDFKVIKNTGALHNEFLCHRLSLVPLCFDVKEIDDYIKFRYNFVLQKTNNTNDIMSVTTQDFKIVDENGNPYPESFVKKILPPNPKTKDYILITKLKPNMYNNEEGEEIHIEGSPSMDIAKSHSRWCPVSLCCFENVVDTSSAEEGLKAFISKYQHDSLSKGELERRFNTLQIQRFFKKNKYGEPNTFRFKLETECRMSCEYIVEKALQILIEKLSKLGKKLTDNDSIEITEENNICVFNIKNEDHTLGNLIQAMFYNLFIRDVEKPVLEYVGYYKPHPLQDNIIIKMKLGEGMGASEFMSMGIKKIVEYIGAIVMEWQSAVSGKTVADDKKVEDTESKEVEEPKVVKRKVIKRVKK